MSNYIIEGGKKLYGETYVSGSKNASLPIMAASVLNRGITKLYNVPNIHDTQMMVEILKNIMDNFKDKTIIYITHRTKCIKLFDRVINLNEIKEV